jgi:hypothetical protein
MTKSTVTEEVFRILAPFSFSAFRLNIRAEEPLHLPSYKGSALRGAFGYTLRRAFCMCMEKDKDCGKCRYSNDCPYSYIFETRPSPDDPFLRNKERVSNPYIIRPPLDEREEFSVGEELSFELILPGKSIEYLPFFLVAFIEMGKTGLGRGKGRFSLSRMETIGSDRSLTPIYHDTDQMLRGRIIKITCGELLKSCPPQEKCRLRFLTRLELKEKEKYPDIRFGVLFRGLLRRITTLAHLHCGIDCSGIDFSGLSHAADEIRTVSSNLSYEHAERYSSRQKCRMPFGGLIGDISFEGELAPFWPFILLGEWVHVGKKTTFGLGRYELKIIEE